MVSNLRCSVDMNRNSAVRHRLAQHRPPRSFVTALASAAIIGSLVVYVGGVHLLLRHFESWVITCGQFIRNVLGCP